MPSKYWEDSADLSRDSSAESTQDNEDSQEIKEMPLKDDQTPEVDTPDGTVSRRQETNFHLPSLPTHEHANLFYLSLIEGRCRTQAAASINHGRSSNDVVGEDHPDVCSLAQHLFTEMSQELVKAGMIPKEYIGRPLSEIRLYLTSFDSVLKGIAARPRDIPAQSSQRAIGFGPTSFENSHSQKPYSATDLSLMDPFDRSQNQQRPLFMQPSIDETSQIEDLTLSSESESMSFFAPAASQALVRRSDAILARTLPQRIGSVFESEFDRPDSTSIPKSKFAVEYETTATLGKGGFGKVVKATSRVDKAEYAIKRIKTPASKMRQLAESGRMEELLNEVQALARYNHPHIVRYFHAWVEMQPAGGSSENTWSTGAGLRQDESQITGEHEESRVNTVSLALESLAMQNQKALDEEFRNRRNNTTTHQLNSDEVIFERDLSSRSATHRSFFRSAADPESSESEGEGKSKNATLSDAGTASTISLSRHPSNDRALASRAGDFLAQSFVDCLIYIKMTSYPLTLADFIFPQVDLEVELTSRLGPLQHCFHPLPSIRILLRLISGLAYLHRKSQIHRDLKPANIFLSILEDGEQPTEAWVDINDCPDCTVKGARRQPYYVSPCIGDFGLVVDLKDLNYSSASDPFEGLDESPRHHVPGTKLYIPPNQSDHNIICPKLDVFALGVISFELLQRFDTKSERFIVVNEARERKWPKDWMLQENIMAEGVAGMMELDRNKRWDCDQVRTWASSVERELKDKALQTLSEN